MLRGAKRAGVRHVVMISIYHTMIDILQHRYKRDIEEKIVESGLNFTILKFHDYMMPEVYVKPVLQGNDYLIFYPVKPGRRQSRSEEHTSELQSLMRISYAVFCLKKKKKN